jgi:hypothetical protein
MMFVGLVTSLFGRFLQGAIARDTEFSADATSAECLASPMPWCPPCARSADFRSVPI